MKFESQGSIILVRPREEGKRTFQVEGTACAKAWRQTENYMFEKLTRLWPGKRVRGEVSRGQISESWEEGLRVSMLWAG